MMQCNNCNQLSNDARHFADAHAIKNIISGRETRKKLSSEEHPLT